jgi:hypothetical protein
MKSNAYTDGLAAIALAIALFSAVQLVVAVQAESPEKQEARLAAAGWVEADIGG